jgi:hypothetical protein
MRGATGLLAAAALSAAAILCALAGPASAAAPPLKVEGKRLVNSRTGQLFVPRGVNWPSFEYACFYGYAYSDEGDPVSTHPTAASARAIARWKINTVRVPLNQACWLGEDGQPAFGDVNGYRAAVQDWISKLHAAGLAVIVDLHWSAPNGTPAEGQRAMPDDRSDDFWTSVATTFKGDRSMIFDLFNEPYSRYDGDTLVFDLSWDCWRNGGCAPPLANDNQPLNGATYTAVGMQALVDAVRATGARQPLMLGGIDYANDLSQWLEMRPDDPQLVASFHNYDSQACNTTACWNRTIAPIAAEVPVVTGEFGQTNCRDDHLRRFMDWADRRRVGYLAWAWWVLPEKDCSVLSVLSDTNGTPKAPNGTALKEHLAGLIPRIALGGPARQALDRAVDVRVSCRRACRVRATGRLAAGGDTFALTPAAGRLRGRAGRTLALRLPRAARRAASSALGARRAVTVTVSVTATSLAGETATKRRTVRLGA